MCGIAGLYSNQPNNIDRDILYKMASTMVHRGPDGTNHYLDDSVGLIHNRLSIIDLSANAAQPMHNEDKTIWFCVNGEIYNYKELRKELENKGHLFYSNSDSEVISHLYEDYGEMFIDKLDGMFAISLWDSKTKTLFLYRDRIGIKPLYYFVNEKTIGFASEPKAILELPFYRLKINENALSNFLSLSYSPDEKTLFKGIEKIMPGTYLKFNDNGKKIKKYWTLEDKWDDNIKENDVLPIIEQKLKGIIDKHLISDVSIGVFLSSGLDSSIIASVSAELTNKMIETFTIGFEEKKYNEADMAGKISDYLGIVNHQKIINTDDNIDLKKIIYHLDDLIPIHFPLYYLNKEVKKHFTVALSGDGGDELFGGYLPYQADLMHNYTRFIPGFLNNMIKSSLDKFLTVSDNKVSLDYTLKRFISGNKLNMPNGHGWWNGMFSESDKMELFTETIKKNVVANDSFGVFAKYFNELQSEDLLKKMMYTDIHTILPNNYLSITDKLSMSNSVEVRPPFLDHNFVEFCFSIPSKYKLGKSLTKRKSLLKKLFIKRYNVELLAKKKMGFSAPINPWLRGKLKHLLDSELNKKRLDNLGYFNANYVNKMVDEHIQYKGNYGFHLWNLINFSLWHRVFVEKENFINN